MGLDIVAYNKLVKQDVVFNAHGQAFLAKNSAPLEEPYFDCHINPDFPGREDTLEDKAVYFYGSQTHFRAGSYSYYNAWRAWLAQVAGYGSEAAAFKATQGPFWELINFSDCEGVIGPKHCVKLLADFERFHALIKPIPGTDWHRAYGNWLKAFRHAADGGAIEFC